MTNQIIGFIGAGNMASSLIGGMINMGYDPSKIMACDPSTEQLNKLKNAVPQGHQVRLESDSSKIGEADIVLLAVKPQILKSVAEDLSPGLKAEAMVISIAAGIPMNSLEAWLGNRAIVRCMPNTPALIQKGASGLYANAAATASQKQAAENILSAVGIAFWVDSEKLINAVTAVSGSGPAYFFLFTELMAEIGVEMGLTEEVSEALSIQTCVGAGMLASESKDSLPVLREKVTSKGGTTYAALERFRKDDLKQLIRNAMTDCADRAEEMAKEFGDS